MIDIHYFVLHFIQGGLGGIPENNANDIVTFKPNQLPLNKNDVGSPIKQHQDPPLSNNGIHDPVKPSPVNSVQLPLVAKPNEPLVGKPNEPSLSTILMDHQLSPLTVSPNKPLAESLDPVNPIDPLSRMNSDRTENHLANSVNLLKPLTANGPTGEERLERLNPINSKDPNGLIKPPHRLNSINSIDPSGLTEPLDRLNPLSSKDSNGMPIDLTSTNQLNTNQLLLGPNEPLKQSLGYMNPLNSNQQLTGMAENNLKPVLSLNQLNTPLMKPISNKVSEHLNFDLMSPHEQLTATGQLDGGKPLHSQLLTNSLLAPAKPLIPGNPGPGIHNNIGGMAGVDGIGPNGLPVITDDINTNFMTTSTLFPHMTTPIPMTTLMQQRHVVMPEDSSCKCAPKSSSCTCKDNLEQTLSSPTMLKPSELNVNNACSYASKY